MAEDSKAMDQEQQNEEQESKPMEVAQQNEGTAERTYGPNAIDITPKKDGGVMKEILREGFGSDSPLTGDKVFVHYVGTLTDGTKFDSSRDRNQKFEFSLGTGSVIKAWDLGVATMKRGELAVLHCKAEYAYGASGSPPKIPPNATLIFEVELFDWKGEDVSEAKDGGIIKSQLVQGHDYSKPKDGASCTVHIVGYHEGREFENREVEFVVGEASEAGVVDGVEQAIKTFKQGEKGRLKISAKYAYGAAGSEQHAIPANANLEYEVTLKKFEKAKESWEMDVPEKIEQSEISKAKGTEFFKAGKYKVAIRHYKKIVDYLKSEESLKEGNLEKRNALMLAAHLNLAMCYLKLDDHYEALQSAEEALKLDANNEKGLYRRGMANLSLQNYESAISDFKAILSMDAENKSAKNQLAVANQRLKAIRDKEKKTYAGMFTKFAEADAKKAQVNNAGKGDGAAETEEKSSPDTDNIPNSEANNTEAMVTSEA